MYGETPSLQDLESQRPLARGNEVYELYERGRRWRLSHAVAREVGAYIPGAVGRAVPISYGLEQGYNAVRDWVRPSSSGPSGSKRVRAPGPDRPQAQVKRTRQRHMSFRNWVGDDDSHLSQMRRRVRTGRRRYRGRRRVGRRVYRRHIRKPNSLKRRRVQYSSKRKFAAAVVDATAAKSVYTADLGFTLKGIINRKIIFVPTADNDYVVDADSLGLSTLGGPVPYHPYDMTIDPPSFIPTADAANCFNDTGLSGNLYDASGLVNQSARNSSLLIGKREYRYRISNQQLHPINIVIHWCVPRHDIAFSAETGDGEGSTGIIPDDSAPFGAADLNSYVCRLFNSDHQLDHNLIPASTSRTMKTFPPSFSPFSSPTFCRSIKVIKSVSKELNAGACMNFVIRRKPWRISLWQLCNAFDYICWKNRSMFPLIEMTGCPVLNANEVGPPVVVDTHKEALGTPLLAFHYGCNASFKALSVGKIAYHYLNSTGPGGTVDTPVYTSKPVAQDLLPN